MTLPPRPYNKYEILRDQHQAVITAQKSKPGNLAAAHEIAQPGENVTSPDAATQRTAVQNVRQDSQLLASVPNQNIKVSSKQDSKLFSEQGSQHFFSEGSAQVPLPCDKASHGNELYDVPSHNLAGASPHAPDRLKRKRGKRKDVKSSVLNIRMPSAMKAKLEAKAALMESYPSSYVLKLVAADLCLPIDEAKLTRSRRLQEEIAALTTALNRLGNNFNQIAKNTNEGRPSPLSRSEVSELLRHHTQAIAHLLKLGFA